MKNQKSKNTKTTLGDILEASISKDSWNVDNIEDATYKANSGLGKFGYTGMTYKSSRFIK